MNYYDPDIGNRATAMAYFAVAKTQAGGGNISELPLWFLFNAYISKEWKEKDLVSYSFSVCWKPYLGPTGAYEIIGGHRTRVEKNPETGERTAIVIQYGAWELNRIDLFDLEISLSKNHVHVSRITDLRVVNVDALDMDLRPERYKLSAVEFSQKCLGCMEETPTVDHPGLL